MYLDLDPNTVTVSPKTLTKPWQRRVLNQLASLLECVPLENCPYAQELGAVLKRIVPFTKEAWLLH